MDKIRVFTTFSGYDSQCLALDRLRDNFPSFDYELVGWSEIDKHAIKAHDALFPQWADRNYGDITKIDWNEVPDFDLFTYSSPCQDFSYAGLQRGGERGSGTRSSLLWECERAISTKRPKFCLLENVAALMSEKFRPLFNEWKLTLERMGYDNFSKILNAKDYGVPQNRERVFLVSVREDVGLRYFFPQPMRLERKLIDVLETNVDHKYYVADEFVSKIIDKSGDKVRVRQATKQGYSEVIEDKAVIDVSYGTSNMRRGRVQEGGAVSPTLTTNANNSHNVIERRNVYVQEDASTAD